MANAISAVGGKLSQRGGCESDPLAVIIETRMERVSPIPRQAVGATHHLKFDRRGCNCARIIHMNAMNGWQDELHGSKADINLALKVKSP